MRILRSQYQSFGAQLNESEDHEESEAQSSPVRPSSQIFSSPVLPPISGLPELPFTELDESLLDDDPDDKTYPQFARATPLSDEEKAVLILTYMKSLPGKLSLRSFLVALFKSDLPGIKNVTAMFMEKDIGPLDLVEIWFSGSGMREYRRPLAKWILEKAGRLCALEMSWLTNRAKDGPHFEEAQRLRISARKVTVALINAFDVDVLGETYHTLLPCLQNFLTTLIGKSEGGNHPLSRNPLVGQTFITSQLLQLRSRETNYHPLMNSLIFWLNRIPKRLSIMFNQIGLCMSPSFEGQVITATSADSVKTAQSAANDPTKSKQLNYDNDNWRERAWQTSAVHGIVQHDEVSAILAFPWRRSDSPPVSYSTSIHRIEASAGQRHRIPRHQGLRETTPSIEDRAAFNDDVSQHVCFILTEEVSSWSHFRRLLPKFTDPDTLPPHKTERYFLPTFDQEQGSVRGNMVVLRHYFLKVLKMAKEFFETNVISALGDRLTTARIRSAQDQLTVDRSENRVDRLASTPVSSGLFHVIYNQIHNIGKNAWGSRDAKDAVSLLTLRDTLPNRAEINLTKVNHYAWLRFIDVVLRSLTLSAATAELSLPSSSSLASHPPADLDALTSLSKKITDKLLSAPDDLEAQDIKATEGHTICGHAQLLFRDLMTIRNMRHAVKHGHLHRIVRMLRYWSPMFYAGGSSNYANELMELLHNLEHDWPKDFAQIQLAGMLVNTTGEEDGFLEADLDVEHLNGDIKERAHGPNATPKLLEKITPAIGPCKELTARTFKAMGVQRINEHHAAVKQHKDVQILTGFMDSKKVFRFNEDTSSEHAVIDLFRHGLRRLSGPEGGHAKHLERHALRFRTRHGENPFDGLTVGEKERERQLYQELENGIDRAGVDCDVRDIGQAIVELVEGDAGGGDEAIDL